MNIFLNNLIFLCLLGALDTSASPGSSDPFSCTTLAKQLTAEWNSVEVEVPVTPRFLKDVDTTDGTVLPLIAAMGSKAELYLSKKKKLYLTSDPSRQWKDLSFREQHDLFSALHTDVDAKAFTKSRKIEGLVFARKTLVQQREIKGRWLSRVLFSKQRPLEFENYIEWASAYDGKPVELEVHMKSWFKTPRKTLLAADEYTRSVSGKKLPVHLLIRRKNG